LVVEMRAVGRRDEEKHVLLRCVLDGLLLEATVDAGPTAVRAYDGDESFALEAVEALYYEIVSATPSEILRVEQACYRLLRRAGDFFVAEP
jgi:hypothetical protein